MFALKIKKQLLLCGPFACTAAHTREPSYLEASLSLCHLPLRGQEPSVLLTCQASLEILILSTLLPWLFLQVLCYCQTIRVRNKVLFCFIFRTVSRFPLYFSTCVGNKHKKKGWPHCCTGKPQTPEWQVATHTVSSFLRIGQTLVHLWEGNWVFKPLQEWILIRFLKGGKSSNQTVRFNFPEWTVSATNHRASAVKQRSVHPRLGAHPRLGLPKQESPVRWNRLEKIRWHDLGDRPGQPAHTAMSQWVGKGAGAATVRKITSGKLLWSLELQHTPSSLTENALTSVLPSIANRSRIWRSQEQ